MNSTKWSGFLGKAGLCLCLLVTGCAVLKTGTADQSGGYLKYKMTVLITPGCDPGIWNELRAVSQDEQLNPVTMLVPRTEERVLDVRVTGNEELGQILAQFNAAGLIIKEMVLEKY